MVKLNVSWLDNYIPNNRRQVYIATGVAIACIGGVYFIYKIVSSKKRKVKILFFFNFVFFIMFIVLKNKSKKAETEVKPEEIVSKLKPGLSEALELNKLGSELFRGSKYEEAVQRYTEAINSCPISEKLELAKCYQNRAAAYQKLVRSSFF